MAILLFCIGALTLAAGAAMIGFGIPINEFSFGNTLIGAGVTAAVGGLIVLALAVVVLKLRQIADRLSESAPLRPAQPADMEDLAAGAAGAPFGQIPFPPRPVARAPQPPAPPVEPPAGQSFAPSFAPTLRNPDEPPPAMAAEEAWPPPPPPAFRFGLPESPARVRPPAPPAAREEPAAAPAEPAAMRGFGFGMQPSPLQERPPGSDFDRMWPPEMRPHRAPPAGPATPEPPPPYHDEAPAPEPARGAEETEAPPLAGQSVAVLKSGVVDGMAYTLYVDGSIEAEMAEGTLRFASINELRDYLESNS